MADAGSTSPFLCQEAITKLCSMTERKSQQLMTKYKDELKLSVLTLCKTNPSILYHISVKSGVRLVIFSNTNSGRKLLIDFRHNENPSYVVLRKSHITWILDDTTHELIDDVRCNKKLSKKTIHPKKFMVPKLDLFKDQSEPQSLEDLKIFLHEKGIEKDVNVTLILSTLQPLQVVWFRGAQTPCAKIHLEAFTRKNLTIGYKYAKQAKVKKKDLIPPSIMHKVTERLPDMKNANRRSSVSVNLKGLTLARSLGLISTEGLRQISEKLSNCVGTLWLTLDKSENVRHLVYCDTKTNFRIEFKEKILKNQEFNEACWAKVFNQISKAGINKKCEKQSILSPVFYSLRYYSSHKDSSAWKSCNAQLKAICNNHRIFLFCENDLGLHTLKGPLTGWCCTNGKKEFSRGVRLHTTADNSLTSLSCSTLVFENLANSFKLSEEKSITSDDTGLWEMARQWLQPSMQDDYKSWEFPILRGPLLKNHPKVRNVPMKTYLFDRGFRNCKAILALWQALAKHYMDLFKFDITTMCHVSNSQIAFQVVWYTYALKAGPLCHAIEKIHPFTEFTLRPWCKGGFSYSCVSEVKAGEPLEPGKENASSIRELDLTSSYGYSAISTGLASGFGVIFTPESGRKGQRHTSFEYMAIMYQLYKWSVIEKRNIRSVFSNFSPLGCISIGKHQIDLTVVFENGTVEMVQMDGHFVHGDYRRKQACTESLPSYVNEQTREEVESKTKIRDDEILQWMLEVAPVCMKYTVITDCCHLEFSKASLKIAFKDIPELQRLVAGMDNLDGSLHCIDYNDMMYLAVVEGYCNTDLPVKPIFAMGQDQPTTDGGKMLITSDYYAYLAKNFNFEIKSIDWIVYYKKCKTLPMVFRELLQLRKQFANVKSKAGNLKSIVNHACGYFGLNSAKGHRTAARMTNKLPQRFSVLQHQVMPIEGMFNNQELIVIKTLKKPSGFSFMCSTPLILFVSIIEYGKLRLNQSLQCLQKYLSPTSWKLLYSNVDNLIISCSKDTFCDAVEDQSKVTDFKNEWSTFIGEDAGLLKLEWEITSELNWKFVSPYKMFYSVLTKNSNESYQKTCSYKGLGTDESYELSLKLLQKVPTQVNQLRRVDKLCNTEKKSVVYNLN